jgi:ribosomal protein S14
MAQIHGQRYCKLCGRKTLHVRDTFGDGWGCFLTIITLGLFLPVWILIAIVESITSKWRCNVCGQGRY